MDSIVESATNVTMTFHRLLNTGDSQDRVIVPTANTEIVWAMGAVTGSTYMKHLPDSHGSLSINFAAPCNSNLFFFFLSPK